MNKTLLMTCVAAIMLGAASAAIVPTQDGSDYILTLESGSDTCSTALTGSGTLYKRGAGEVELTVAANGFSGKVVVEAGTLTISHVSAVGGSSVPITVQEGATLWLKVPGKGQNSNVAFPHNVTIAGKGVGNNGALRYTNTGSTNADSLLNRLELSADATIDATTRWGMGDGKIIELNGHTLTRIGAGNWMVYNHIQSTGAPGEVNNVYGMLTLQNTPDIDENVTVVVTNIDSSCVLGLWGVTSADTIKGQVKLYSGRTIEAQSGSAKTSNTLGPLHIAGPNTGSVKLLLERNSAARTMSIAGPVTSDDGMKTTVEGKGSIWFNNDVSLSGNTTFSCGNAYLCGEESKRSIKLVLNGGNTTTHEAGNTFLRMLRVANGGAVSAQLRQTGGVMAVQSSDNARLAGEASGSRGYYTLEGGVMCFSNTTYMAEKTGSFGAFRQTGGLLELRRSNGANFYAGRGGSALFVQTGGTNDTLIASNTQEYGIYMSTNGMSEVTVSGNGTLLRTGVFQMCTTGCLSTNIFNVRDGAVVKANRFRKSYNLPEAATRAYVNIDGGVFMPTFAWNITGGLTHDKADPDHFVVWDNGMIVDTSENAVGGGVGDSTLQFAFEKPTGNGVESITLPDLTGKTYIGLGHIVIEDETGWGASAYAEFDFTSKTLTHVVVTSRGCNYSDNAKAYLESPAGTSRYECGLTLSSNEGRCGMFVKRGAPTLVLSSESSTIDGGYAVEGGRLNLGVVPNVAVPVRVENGATLNLNNKGALTASTFEGSGTVTNGNVTVTGAVKATCADLFAGKSAFFSGNLTFADGAVFEVTDAENLEAYKNAKHTVALTFGGALSRVPSVRLTTSGGTTCATGDSWSLRLSADGKSLKFGRDKGIVISFK